MFCLHADGSTPASLTPCSANKTFIKLTEGFEERLFVKNLCAVGKQCLLNTCLGCIVHPAGQNYLSRPVCQL